MLEFLCWYKVVLKFQDLFYHNGIYMHDIFMQLLLCITSTYVMQCNAEASQQFIIGSVFISILPSDQVSLYLHSSIRSVIYINSYFYINYSRNFSVFRCLIWSTWSIQPTVNYCHWLLKWKLVCIRNRCNELKMKDW